MAHRVLVFGDDTSIFLGVVRSLGRIGLEIHAAPSDFSSPALQSRYVAATHRLPPYTIGAEEWLAALIGLIESHDFRLIFPTSDISLHNLLRHADRIGRWRLAIPNTAGAATFTDKAATRELALELGVPVARGKILEDTDTAAMLAEGFGLPLIVKAIRSYTPGDIEVKLAARIFADVDELRRAIASRSGADELVESFISGFCRGLSVIAHDGEILQAIQHRRLHQSSDTGASSSRITEATDPRLLDWTRRMIAARRFDGVAMFEFRHHEGTDDHYLLEVNPRFWGSLPLAMAAGADYPATLFAKLVENIRPQPQWRFQSGVSKISMFGEYERLADEFGRLDSLGARLTAASKVLPRAADWCTGRHCDSWARDDRRPHRAERRRLLGRVGSALAKRLRRWAALAFSVRRSSARGAA